MTKLVAALKLLNHVVAVLRRHETATHGWSGHARFNVLDVPGLRDRSAVVIAHLDELDSAVVIRLYNPHGIQVWIGAMLASCASFDCHHITFVVRMWLSLGVFTLVVLNDEPLLSFFDELSIRLEGGIQHCVTAKHQLCRHCLCSGVHCRIHDGFATCRQNTFETKERIQIPFVLDLRTVNHVVKCLVTFFNHGVRLWIATGDNLLFDATFVIKSFADFSGKFFSFVHSHFCRPWMSCEPMDFQPVGCRAGSLFTDLCHFEESCRRICHSHTMKFNVCFGLFWVAEFAWAHQVNTQCVPGNDFRIGLRWKQTNL